MEFIVGRAGTGKTAACLEEMRSRMEREPLGGALIFIVPEHTTYKLERELAASIPNGKGCLRGYVLGFRRFARQILVETGGAALPRITDVGRGIMLKKILNGRHGELAAFSRAAKQRGFAATLSEAIKELKSYRLDAETLKKVSAQTVDSSLGGKLADLSLLAADFQNAMQGRYNDAEDIMDTLAERLPSSSLVKDAEIWIDGFIFFNPQEQRVIRELMRLAKNVHVSLLLDCDENHAENIRETGIFHRAFKTKKILEQMAAELGIDKITTRRLHETARYKNDALKAVEKNLFSFPTKKCDAHDGITIVEAANKRIEAEMAAADIIRLCREKNYRLRDIGIVIRDDDGAATLKPVLKDYGIPFFAEEKTGAANHPLAELLRSSLELVGSWRYEAIFRALRTGFFPILREQTDILENYVLEFGIKGKKHWLAEDAWNWRRFYSLDDDAADSNDDDETLAAIDFLRRTAIKPAADLFDSLKKAKTVREITAALYDYLTALDVVGKLQEWQQEAEREGRLEAAAMHRQVWNGVAELFDQMIETGGDERMSIKDYAAAIEGGLDALTVSLIPPGLDYVTVASFDQNSLENIRAIYVLGANDGTIPRRVRQSGVFTDADRLRLKDMGITLPAGSVETALTEKYLLYRGFTKASEYLWVSYPLADLDGEGLLPSPVVKRIRAAFVNATFFSVPLEIAQDEEQISPGRADISRIACRDKAASNLTLALRTQRDTGKMASWWQDVYNKLIDDAEPKQSFELALSGLFATATGDDISAALATKLFAKNRRMRGSVTRFEEYRRCPFSHFAKYGLKLKERREQRFSAPDLGLLLHGALKNFGERLKKENRLWRDVSAGEAEKIIDEIMAELAPKLQNKLLLSTAQYRRRLSRITQLAKQSVKRLIALDKAGRFHPVAYERTFEKGELSFRLPDGTLLETVGQIDRIDFDEDEKYFIVMDYKTGKADLKLTEVYYGLKLQLLTYLLVAKNILADGRKKMLPAGMLYFFLRRSMQTANRRLSPEEAERAREAELKMTGWALDDPQTIAAIDGTGRFIGIKLTKDGGISKTNKNRVKSREEFDVLIGYTEKILRATGSEILSGRVKAAPYILGGKLPCNFCPYPSVCGIDLSAAENGVRELEERNDEEMMNDMRLIAGKENGDDMDTSAGAGD